MTKKEALEKFLDIWSDGDMLCDIGSSLNCCAAEALANLLIAYGEPDSAECLLESHIAGDDDEDDDIDGHKKMSAQLEEVRMTRKFVLKQNDKYLTGHYDASTDTSCYYFLARTLEAAYVYDEIDAKVKQAQFGGEVVEVVKVGGKLREKPNETQATSP